MGERSVYPAGNHVTDIMLEDGGQEMLKSLSHLNHNDAVKFMMVGNDSIGRRRKAM
jgi:hypothetical protein